MRAIVAIMALFAACGPSGSQSIGLPLSYETNVRPIVASYCAGCHKPGGQVELTADNLAALRSEAIKRLDDCSMPPWLPGDDSLPLLNSRALPTGAKDTIKAWFAAGYPTGSYYPGPLPLPPARPMPDRPADAEVMFPPPVPVSAESYRCYAKPLPVSGIAEATEIVIADSAHHAGVTILAAADVPLAMKDPAGADCINGISAPLLANLSSVGGGPTRGQAYAPDIGQPLPTGAWVVLNIHALPGAQTKPFGVRFWLGPAGPRIPLQLTSVIAPIEVPCPGGPQATGPCSRADAFARSKLIPPADQERESGEALVRCGHTLDELTAHLPPGDGDHYLVHTDCAQPAPVGRIHFVQPHLHIGFASWRLEFSRRGGPWQTLLSVPFWRGPRTEEAFGFVDPVVTGPTDRLRVSCELDNGPLSQPGLDGSIPGDYPAQAPRLPPIWRTGGFSRDNLMCAAFISWSSP